MPKKRIADTLALGLLLVVGFSFYYPLTEGDLMTDDLSVIRFVAYGPIADGELNSSQTPGIFGSFWQRASKRFELYRPIVGMSFWLNYAMSGVSSFGYLLTNIIVHLTNVFLLAVLIKRLFPDLHRVAWLMTVAMFLFHPFQMQVVGWSAARSDSLSFMFGMLALLTIMSKGRRTVAAAFLAFLALLCKESGIVWLFLLLPFFVASGDAAPRAARSHLLARLRQVSPLLIVGLAYFSLRQLALGGISGDTQYGSKSLADLLGELRLSSLAGIVRVALAPVSAAVAYALPLKIIQSTGAVFLLALGIKHVWRRGKRVAFMAACSLGVPLFMAFVVGALAGGFLGSRAYYTPMLGAAILAACAFKAMPKLSLGISILLLATFFPSSLALRENLIQCGKKTGALRASLRSAVAELKPESVERVVVLNYSQAQVAGDRLFLLFLPDEGLTRPFMPGDFAFSRVRDDVPEKGFEYMEVFPELFRRDMSKTAFLKSRYQESTDTFTFTVLHRGTLQGTEGQEVQAVAPLPFSVSEIDLDDRETWRPRFQVRHRAQDGLRFRIEILACKGRVLRLVIPPIKAEMQGGMQTTHLLLPPLPQSMIQSLKDPRAFGWSVAVIDRGGRVLGSSPMSLFVARLK